MPPQGFAWLARTKGLRAIDALSEQEQKITRATTRLSYIRERLIRVKSWRRHTEKYVGGEAEHTRALQMVREMRRGHCEGWSDAIEAFSRFLKHGSPVA